MANLKLYMTPGSCSTGIHILMEELELIFVLIYRRAINTIPIIWRLTQSLLFQLWLQKMARRLLSLVPLLTGWHEPILKHS